MHTFTYATLYLYFEGNFKLVKTSASHVFPKEFIYIYLNNTDRNVEHLYYYSAYLFIIIIIIIVSRS